MLQCYSLRTLLSLESIQTRLFAFRQSRTRGRANTRKESAKIRNRKMLKKYNGTATHPRLSVFCSDKQLYAMVVDDKNRSCFTLEAAQRVGEALVKACDDLNIKEISSYDRNGLH
ncbi:hypothetical protein VNO80_06616 [Phaseolus coccineus]|uniref:50S ribosomal protein L18, chloroplastic n=1 Tax=Phaseolus coccineus TaxID=3886 RepID=A0AAN9RJ42_PHACN